MDEFASENITGVRKLGHPQHQQPQQPQYPHHKPQREEALGGDVPEVNNRFDIPGFREGLIH